MYALIDADVLLYRAAFSVESRMYILHLDDIPIYCSSKHKDIKAYCKEHDLLPSKGCTVTKKVFLEEDCVYRACYNFDHMLKGILKATDATGCTLYLTGKGNFRHDIYPEYKAGRPPKPLVYQQVRQHILDDLRTEEVEGMEADDALAIAQTDSTVICSVDKDLLMVTGNHYNFVKHVHSYTTPEEGTRRFYTQLLTGDNVDNIPGLKGIGPKKAEKILEDCITEWEMYRKVIVSYVDSHIEESIEYTEKEVLRNGRLLWMVRDLDKEGKPVMWEAPNGI